MPYVNFLKENLSVKAVAFKCLKLAPCAAFASLKLWALFALFNVFAALMFLSFGKDGGGQTFICASFCAPLFCAAVNYVLACSCVKITQDCANGAKQDVLGAIILVLKKFIPLCASSLLIGAATYFLIYPSGFLSGPFKRGYFVFIALVYVFFASYIIFHPWNIMLEDKTVFESFRASYHLVKKHWLKCTLLFFCSGFAAALAFFAALCLCAAFALWLNWDAFSFLWRLNVSLGDMPSNIKTAVLLAELAPFGPKAVLSLAGLICFTSYIAVFGLNMFAAALSLSYKTLNAYKLMADNPPKPAPEKTAEEELAELAALFKDVKEITINPQEEESAAETDSPGHLDRREVLRSFNKEDEDTANYGRVKPVIHEYPDPDPSEK